MLVDEQWFSIASRRSWNWALSARDNEVGSGLIMLAANAALAMARE